jgi:hypothetical protein
MFRTIAALVLALGLTAVLARPAQANPRAFLEPYYVENYAPGGLQTWYLANDNPNRPIKVTVSEMQGGVRIRDLVITINPGQSMYVGTRQPNDNRGWQIISAHYR